MNCADVQGSTNTASGTLLTAMSRLADESKTDRAPLRSAHRKRKMQEAPPSAAAAGLNKLKPSTMSLPPVSMPKQAYKPAPAVPMHASAVCRPDVAHPDIAANSGHSQPQLSSQPMQSNTASQSSMSANKRAKHEQGYDNTVSQLRPLAEYAAKSDDDAETETDGSSQHVRAAQRPACTVSSSSNVLPAATTFFDPVKALPLTAQVLTHPQSNAHKPEAVFHRLADQLLGQSSVAQRSVAASDSTALPVATLPATDNSMAVLAHAAAAASEGGAETTSSRADTEDDKGAAAILRDLRSSPSPQPSPVAGQCIMRITKHKLRIVATGIHAFAVSCVLSCSVACRVCLAGLW